MKKVSILLVLVLAIVAFLTVSPASADLYVSTFLDPTGNNSVLRYDETTGALINTFAVGLDPAGVAFGPDGNLYVATGGLIGGLVLRFTPAGEFINTFVGPDLSISGPLDVVFGPDGNLYVGDVTNGVLRYDGQTGQFLGTFVPPFSGGLVVPFFMVFGPDGNLYVSYGLSGVLRYDGQTGQFLGMFVAPPLGNLSGLRFGFDGNLYFVEDVQINPRLFLGRVLRYNPSTGMLDEFVPFTSCGLSEATDLAFGHDGNLYVLDGPGQSVRRYDGRGNCIGTFASIPGLGEPYYMTFTP